MGMQLLIGKLLVPNSDCWHLPAGPVGAPGNSTLLVNHDPS